MNLGEFHSLTERISHFLIKKMIDFFTKDIEGVVGLEVQVGSNFAGDSRGDVSLGREEEREEVREERGGSF